MKLDLDLFVPSERGGVNGRTKRGKILFYNAYKTLIFDCNQELNYTDDWNQTYDLVFFFLIKTVVASGYYAIKPLYPILLYS